MQDEILNTLKLFGHDTFRKGQLEATEAILNKRDVCVFLSTSSGKSLCFQLAPFVFKYRDIKTTAFIVSPLISLMIDQVYNLNTKFKSEVSCFLGSAQTDLSIESDVYRYKYTIVYITPEKLNSEYFQNKIKDMNVSLIGIDEAHCMSEYETFRKDYRLLNNIRNYYNGPIIALTATATTAIKNDIIKTLQLKDPLIITSTFNRPNLSYNIHLKKTFDEDLQKIASIINKLKKGSIIVYALKRKETTTIADKLKNLCNVQKSDQIEIEAYHAGLPLDKRSKIIDKFKNDKIKCIVCTLSFGLGIDNPDIRYVIHYGIPKSLEGYYQEIGRAGRSGKKSICMLFWSPKDLELGKFFAEGPEDLKRLDKITEYVMSDRCRRTTVLNYFDEVCADNCFEIDPENVPCDYCRKHKNSVLEDITEEKTDYTDYTDDVRLLLLAIKETYSRYGITVIVDYLRGSGNKKILSVKKSLKNTPTFGLGFQKSIDYWKNLHLFVQTRGLLIADKVSKNMIIYKLTDESIKFLSGSEKLLWYIPTISQKSVKSEKIEKSEKSEKVKKVTLNISPESVDLITKCILSNNPKPDKTTKLKPIFEDLLKTSYKNVNTSITYSEIRSILSKLIVKLL